METGYSHDDPLDFRLCCLGELKNREYPGRSRSRTVAEDADYLFCGSDSCRSILACVQSSVLCGPQGPDNERMDGCTICSESAQRADLVAFAMTRGGVLLWTLEEFVLIVEHIYFPQIPEPVITCEP